MYKRISNIWMLLLGLWCLLPATAGGQSSRSTGQPPDEPSSSQTQSATTAESSSQSPNLEALDLTEEVIRDVLSNLQKGLESRSLNQVLSIFDQQGMANYADVRNQLMAFFQQYEAVQFRYQVLQATAQKGRGFVTADVDMDATPAEGAQVGLRRTLQIRLQLKLGAKGWKVVGFKPADLFTQ